MGWSIGFDDHWNRHIGYGVPAYCDHPKCDEEIDRGLAYVCGGHPYGGERGCGLFFCSDHLTYADFKLGETVQVCERCQPWNPHDPFAPKPEHPTWIEHVSTDQSWAKWRAENPAELARMRGAA